MKSPEFIKLREDLRSVMGLTCAFIYGVIDNATKIGGVHGLKHLTELCAPDVKRAMASPCVELMAKCGLVRKSGTHPAITYTAAPYTIDSLKTALADLVNKCDNLEIKLGVHEEKLLRQIVYHVDYNSLPRRLSQSTTQTNIVYHVDSDSLPRRLIHYKEYIKKGERIEKRPLESDRNVDQKWIVQEVFKNHFELIKKSEYTLNAATDTNDARDLAGRMTQLIQSRIGHEPTDDELRDNLRIWLDQAYNAAEPFHKKNWSLSFINRYFNQLNARITNATFSQPTTARPSAEQLADFLAREL